MPCLPLHLSSPCCAWHAGPPTAARLATWRPVQAVWRFGRARRWHCGHTALRVRCRTTLHSRNCPGTTRRRTPLRSWRWGCRPRPPATCGPWRSARSSWPLVRRVYLLGDCAIPNTIMHCVSRFGRVFRGRSGRRCARAVVLGRPKPRTRGHTCGPRHAAPRAAAGQHEARTRPQAPSSFCCPRGCSSARLRGAAAGGGAMGACRLRRARSRGRPRCTWYVCARAT
jgi:hypothetical protein